MFDLKCSDGEFFLQCGGPSPPYLDLVEFSCSLAEVEKLDTQSRAARGSSFKLVNFESLPEVFRAIGRRIDDRDGQLLRVCNSDLPFFPDSVTVEYHTRDRRRHVEKFFLSSMSEHALRMYKTRARRFAN
ncbi:MAG: hypothetical protein ACREP3_12840 [Candidatus Binatia bacterium]